MANSIDKGLVEAETRIIGGLKEFQKRTVDRIDEIFRSSKGQKRILIADEVGLGKTLVAKGAIVKFAKMRKEEGDDLVKVVYICANGAITEQNMKKLRINQNVRIEKAESSRLSMQHLQIFEQERDKEIKKGYVQLIPLTPDTSFRMTSGKGTVKERALMYAILRRIKGLIHYSQQLEILFREGAQKSWDRWCKDYYEERVLNCNKKTRSAYFLYMKKEIDRELNSEIPGDKTLKEALIAYCQMLEKSEEPTIASKSLIEKLRLVFAKVTLKKLEPDLVIMDEFQRFRFLLSALKDENSESDTGLLVKKFFNSDDVRVLLLSATPYKMYSTIEEIDENMVDEHYSEFLDVMHFLNEGKAKSAKFETIWKDYSVLLRELTIGNTTLLEATKNAKKEAENEMFNAVCRTERRSAENAADLINDIDVFNPIEISEEDVLSYIQAQKLLYEMGASYSVPMDYIKSVPYVMSFMRDYKLKKNIENYFETHKSELSKANKSTFWIDYNTVNKYKKLKCTNAKVKKVMCDVLKEDVEKLLWVPPSKPYYEVDGPFNTFHNTFSKTLIFSTWEMVPRMISSLFSYEVERRTVGRYAEKQFKGNSKKGKKKKKKGTQNKPKYFSNTKDGAGKTNRYPAPRLKFKIKDNEPSSMTLFCLLYPSRYLTEIYDPICCLNNSLNLEEIEETIQTSLNELIREKFGEIEVVRGKEDNKWYYVLPMLLDDKEYVEAWFDECEKLWDSDDIDEQNSNGKEERTVFKLHFEKLRKLYDDAYREHGKSLGRMPDDLAKVMADMAIASPAICMNRTYMNVSNGNKYKSLLPSRFARAFLYKMDSPESISAIELTCGTNSDFSYWRALLEYSKQGNIQAMLDEYAHMVIGASGGKAEAIDKLNREIVASMKIRTAAYPVDTYKSFKDRINGDKDSRPRIRTHYASAFTVGEGSETDNKRKTTLRNAFNSPFRPFILATTSIGQEGLDFHYYCRQIVHWNLPSNPVDLEQREGRINRFKCLAIRQNVVKRYGKGPFSSNDVWNEMFNEADEKEKEKSGDKSDLIPYWGLTESDDMVKIERIVPMYPFSRDELSYERLLRILSLYRLTLGQARQEELLEYLFKNTDEKDRIELKKDMFMNLSPYYKNIKGND